MHPHENMVFDIFPKDMYFSYDISAFPTGNMCVGDDRITFQWQTLNSLEKPDLHNFQFEASPMLLDCLRLLSVLSINVRCGPHTSSAIWMSNTTGENRPSDIEGSLPYYIHSLKFNL